MIVPVVMVAMVVPPGPVFLLFLWWQLAKVSVAVPMRLVRPLAVINNLVIIPNVIVGVVGVVYSRIMMLTGKSGQ